LFCRPLGTGNATNSHDKNPNKRRAGRSFIIHLNTRTFRNYRAGIRHPPLGQTTHCKKPGPVPPDA